MAGGATEASASAIFKKLYEGSGTHMQVLDINKLWNRYEKTQDHIEGGSSIVFPLQTSFSEGLGVRGENEGLPTPQNVNYGLCDFGLIKLTGSCAISGEAWMKSRAKGAASFVNALIDEHDGVMEAFYRDAEGQLFRDGSGLRGVTSGAVGGAAGSTTVTLLNTTTNQGCKWITQGMLVDFYTAGGVLLQGSVPVTSVNKNANTFVAFNLTTVIADGSYVYREGNKGRELVGLDGFVNDTSGPATVQGITVSGNDYWTSTVLDNSGTARPISINLLESLVKASGQQNNKKPNILIMGFTQHQKYAQLVVQTVQTRKEANTGGKVTLDAGYENLTYMSIPIIESVDCQDDRVYALQDSGKEGMKIWTIDGVRWLTPIDNTKLIWYKLEGKDQYRADFAYFAQAGGYRRNIQACLQDLSR